MWQKLALVAASAAIPALARAIVGQHVDGPLDALLLDLADALEAPREPKLFGSSSNSRP